MTGQAATGLGSSGTSESAVLGRRINFSLVTCPSRGHLLKSRRESSPPCRASRRQWLVSARGAAGSHAASRCTAPALRSASEAGQREKIEHAARGAAAYAAAAWRQVHRSCSPASRRTGWLPHCRLLIVRARLRIDYDTPMKNDTGSSSLRSLNESSNSGAVGRCAEMHSAQ